MKRLVNIFILLVVALSASAQTYNNGTWYSLYDTKTHTMNTQGDYETGGVFAPTAGTLNVKWNYEWIDWLGVARKIDTDVLESSDGGNNSKTVGSLKENTSDGSNTTESFTVSRDINWIKFERSGLPTHKVNVYHIDIPLAKHILLASGNYGATTASYDFGQVNALSTSDVYKINLRSFLTAGDITITSSNPEIFHVGDAANTESLVYAVGANACASENGKADVASATTLGKIANYAIPVYFTPKEGKDYGAVITITDGVSAATVALTGKGIKLDQTITWEPKTPILSNASVDLAQASSELPIEYSFEPEGIVAYENGLLNVLTEGVVSITASQPGNTVYNAAQPVTKQITVFPAKTSFTYERTICETDVYSDEHFQNLTEIGLYYDTIPNVYGGDSVICLSLKHNSAYLFEDARTVFVGVQEEWEGVDLSLIPVGDSTLVVKYATVAGCDSVYKLALTVIPRPVSYGNDTIWLCAGESFEYEGKTYKRPCKDSVLVSEHNVLGGDSIVEFVVYVFPIMKMQASQTVVEGVEQTWQNIDLSTIPAGDTTLVAKYTSVNGCDSTYILKLTVTPKITTGVGNTHINDDLRKVIINGQLYIRKGDAWYDLCGKKVQF